MKTVTVRMSDELHKDFKVMTVLSDKTMNDRIIDLISEDIKKFKKNEEKKL